MTGVVLLFIDPSSSMLMLRRRKLCSCSCPPTSYPPSVGPVCVQSPRGSFVTAFLLFLSFFFFKDILTCRIDAVGHFTQWQVDSGAGGRLQRLAVMLCCLAAFWVSSQESRDISNLNRCSVAAQRYCFISAGLW